ncbi:MAG: hypothetical protein HZB21_06595 [Deltaproteobacteria bacterium]|nr:hypothetical protein [Deltaproteobacteria bacterium]
MTIKEIYKPAPACPSIETFEGRLKRGIEDPSGRQARARKALSGKDCLVVGLASTGISVSRFLKECGALVAATDMKDEAALAGIDKGP